MEMAACCMMSASCRVEGSRRYGGSLTANRAREEDGRAGFGIEVIQVACVGAGYRNRLGKYCSQPHCSINHKKKGGSLCAPASVIQSHSNQLSNSHHQIAPGCAQHVLRGPDHFAGDFRLERLERGEQIAEVFQMARHVI